MKSEQIKEIRQGSRTTCRCVERRPQRNADGLSKGDRTLPPLQPPECFAQRFAEAARKFRICAHLRDVIARVVFKECAYDGTYQSPLLVNFGPQPVDWVTPTTTPDKLGFS